MKKPTTPVDMSVSWKASELQRVLKSYSRDNFYNTAETGFFYQPILNRSIPR